MSRRKLAILALMGVVLGIVFFTLQRQNASLVQLTDLLERAKVRMKQTADLPLGRAEVKGDEQQIRMEILLVEIYDRQAPTPTVGLLGNTDELTHLIETLKAQNLCTVQSQPIVQTLDCQSAFVVSGQEFSVLGPPKDGVPSVQYKRIGSIVNMKAQFLNGNCIYLEARGDVSNRIEGESGIFGRYVDIAVSIPDGQTLVIAGLRGKRRKRMWKAPLVGDLPFIGSWFHFQKEVESENLFLVTPRRVISKQ